VKEDIRKQLLEARNVLDDFLSDQSNLDQIEQASVLLVESFLTGGKVISCGNGGSHCDAMHFAEELSGKFRENRRALPAIAVSDSSHITCTGNDYGFEFVFSRFVEALGNPGDVLLGISTSGNSHNVVEAIKKAREKEMSVILLTGNDGGKMASMGDVEIRVPYQGFADRIQEVHIKIIHTLIFLVEQKLFPSRDE
jgi:D-sedoheptulose 7-phosphate isomerase